MYIDQANLKALLFYLVQTCLIKKPSDQSLFAGGWQGDVFRGGVVGHADLKYLECPQCGV